MTCNHSNQILSIHPIGCDDNDDDDDDEDEWDD